MASLKEIKGRIGSVQSTQKITSAMKMVASAKLHHAQTAITHMLPYEKKLFGMLSAFLADDTDVQSPYTVVRPVQRVAIIAFSSNSSLCGAFNSNVARKLVRIVIEKYKDLPRENIRIYPVGKKIAEAARKEGFLVQGEYDSLAEKPLFAETSAIAYKLMRQFADKEIDRVEILYHHLKSTSTQILVEESFLPISLEEMRTRRLDREMADYIVEPSSEELIETLLPQAIALRLFTALLDSNASEHSARMLAMQMATDNADDLLQELTLVYNKSRQQAITSELLDIIGGSMK